LPRRQLRVGVARAWVCALNRGSGGSWACGPEAKCSGDDAGEEEKRRRKGEGKVGRPKGEGEGREKGNTNPKAFKFENET
jgi:hypothetical protein